MTREELKEIVRQLVGRNRISKAMDKIIQWAQENHQDQLKKEISLLQGNLTNLDREKRLGLLSNSEASTRQNIINYSVLDLLDNVDDNIPNKDKLADRSTTNGTEDTPSSGTLKILMLTSNPANTTKLNLDREYAVISRKLQQKQDYFNIILEKAVSGSEFKEFTQQQKPDILHFSGHGEKGKYAGIVVQNEDKNERALIPISGLKALFKFFEKRFDIKVVLLNACHTQEQAAVISAYVDYVIGTNVAIGDIAASAFSSGFYFQMAEDDEMSIERAFDSGRTEAVLKGAAEENFVIYRKGELIEIT